MCAGVKSYGVLTTGSVSWILSTKGLMYAKCRPFDKKTIWQEAKGALHLKYGEAKAACFTGKEIRQEKTAEKKLSPSSIYQSTVQTIT